MNFNTVGEILQDIKNDKEVNWSGKHMGSKITEKSMARLMMFGRAERVGNCANWLRFAECPQGHHKKLVGASFCRDRLCPMCNWRRSRMLSQQILEILHTAQERRKMRFLFLTLTIKNVSGDKLSETITTLFKAYNALFKYKDVDKNMVGWIRNLEVTYNEQDETFHPHFHVLLAVNELYFKGGEYISQAKWTSLWQKALDIDYVPMVNIKAVKPKKEGQTVDSAVSEIAKYSVKDTDYLKDSEDETDKIVAVLAVALNGRRLIGFGKLFRAIRKELKQKDVESETADLVNADEGGCQCPICNSTLIEQLYSWNYGVSNYISK